MKYFILNNLYRKQLFGW